MSPKIVNGSFAAVYDQNDILAEYSATFTNFRNSIQNSPSMRRRIRGILMSGKQFSLDSRLDLFHGIENDQGMRTVSEPTTTPLLEDSQESEENTVDHQCSRKMDNALLSPPPNRHGRSRSVDHQIPILITETTPNKCEKCGHLVFK